MATTPGVPMWTDDPSVSVAGTSVNTTEILAKKTKKKKKKRSKSSKRQSSSGDGLMTDSSFVANDSSFSMNDSSFSMKDISEDLLSKAQQDIERRKQKKSKRKSTLLMLEQETGESTDSWEGKKPPLSPVNDADRKLSPDERLQASFPDVSNTSRSSRGSKKRGGGTTPKTTTTTTPNTTGDARSVNSDDSSIFSSQQMMAMGRKPSPRGGLYDRSSMLEDTDSYVGGMRGRSDESVSTFGVLMKQPRDDETWGTFPSPKGDDSKQLSAIVAIPQSGGGAVPMAISAKTKSKRGGGNNLKSPPPGSNLKSPPPGISSNWEQDAFPQQDALFDSRNQDVSVTSGSASNSASNSNSHSNRSGGYASSSQRTKSSGESTPQIRNVWQRQVSDMAMSLNGIEEKAAGLMEWAPVAMSMQDYGNDDSVAASSTGGDSRVTQDMLVSYLQSMGTSTDTASKIAASFREQQRQQGGIRPAAIPEEQIDDSQFHMGGLGVDGVPEDHFQVLGLGSGNVGMGLPVSSSEESSGRQRRRGTRRERRSRGGGSGILYERAMEPGAVPMEGRAFGAPRAPPRPELGPDGGSMPFNDEPPLSLDLVQATAVQNKSSGPIVYADSTPLSIKDMLKEKPIRRRLCFLAFVIIASITISVSLVVVNGGGGGSDDGLEVGTIAPTGAPSTSPTFISSEVFQYAALLSGPVVSDPSSAQFRAIGWMSTFDTVVDSFGELFNQRYTMATFFYSLGGENWLEQDSWMDPDMHECDWSEAIFCRVDGTGRRLVNGIDLTRNGLQGNLPAELKHTPHLEFLRLSKNGINGTLPSEIFSLPSLSVLDMNSNAVTGSMPIDMGDKRALVFLDLSFNQITGTLPQGYYELTLLRISELSFNQISGTIATEVANLRVLSKFNLASNQISGSIPTGFDEDNIPVFDLIDLSHNSLTGSVPEWFTGLFSRQELVCHHNFLTGPVPGVSSTAIAEFLSDPESLESVRLKRVDMAHNMMTGSLPAWAGFLPSIKIIDFAYNEFTGTLPLGVLLGQKLFAGIETFRAANCSLTGLISADLPEQIKELDLQGNDFSGTIPLEIAKFTSLQFFFVGNNPRLGGEIAPLLKNTVNLKTFSARNTSMTGRLDGGDWMSLTKMELLDLSFNSFEGTIPTEWGNLPSLKKLVLDNNAFTGLIPTDLGHLDDLLELKLADNVFVGKIPSELGLLESLEVLTLANNNLLHKVPSELGQLENLKTLTLSGNGLLQGTIPEALCGMNFSRYDIGCQLECSCCIDTSGYCAGTARVSSSDVFDNGERWRGLRGL